MHHTIADNIAQVYKRIAEAELHYGRVPHSTMLLAVSKEQSVEKIEAAMKAGIWHFGENYVQEALEKIAYFSRGGSGGDLKEGSEIDAKQGSNPIWHFIGRIQSNKIGLIAKHFDWVHSVQAYSHAQLLNDARLIGTPPLNVLIQLERDSNISMQNLLTLAEKIDKLPNLRLRGLMYLPFPAETIDQQRVSFRFGREAFQVVRAKFPHLDTLSMGMSQDLEAAIAEGATLIRVGTALFGPRGK